MNIHLFTGEQAVFLQQVISYKGGGYQTGSRCCTTISIRELNIYDSTLPVYRGLIPPRYLKLNHFISVSSLNVVELELSRESKLKRSNF